MLVVNKCSVFCARVSDFVGIDKKTKRGPAKEARSSSANCGKGIVTATGGCRIETVRTRAADAGAMESAQTAGGKTF